MIGHRDIQLSRVLPDPQTRSPSLFSSPALNGECCNCTNAKANNRKRA
jgi:hypothetical protein